MWFANGLVNKSPQYLLKLTWSAYFDDFLCLGEAASAKHTGTCIASLFPFLGWKLSENKLVHFDSECKVLGFKWF